MSMSSFLALVFVLTILNKSKAVILMREVYTIIASSFQYSHVI